MTRPIWMKMLVVVRTLVLAAISIGLLAAATYASVYLMTNEARPSRRKPPPVTPMVEVTRLEAEDAPILIEELGTVIPAVEVNLQAEVSGRIVSKHPEFIEGGIVMADETLLEIDPRDYELDLVSRRAQVETARSELQIEQGQQEVAEREWEILGAELEAGIKDRELALRQPQLRRKQSDLRAAEAEAAQAEIELERTKVRAPFNAIVLRARNKITVAIRSFLCYSMIHDRTSGFRYGNYPALQITGALS